MLFKGQLEEAQAQNLASDPSNLPDGLLWFNTTTLLIKAAVSGVVQSFVTRKVTGSRASPQAIVAGTGVAYVATGGMDQTWFVQGSGGPVTISANPAIAAGTVVGQRLKLIGRSDTNTVTIGGGVALGVSQNGDMVLGDDCSIIYEWDGTYWQEESRRDNA